MDKEFLDQISEREEVDIFLFLRSDQYSLYDCDHV